MSQSSPCFGIGGNGGNGSVIIYFSKNEQITHAPTVMPTQSPTIIPTHVPTATPTKEHKTNTTSIYANK